MAIQKATFAAGCFWGVEEAFRVCGKVLSTRVGYTGGKTSPTPPTYQLVCSGSTGHAEAVEVDYDASSTNYQDLLDLFWSIHDPTTVDRQGYDIGSQYRSAIFYHSEEQKELAMASKEAQQKLLASAPRGSQASIVTLIEPAGPFYTAEEYHQQYLMKKGGGAACGLSRRPY